MLFFNLGCAPPGSGGPPIGYEPPFLSGETKGSPKPRQSRKRPPRPARSFAFLSLNSWPLATHPTSLHHHASPTLKYWENKSGVVRRVVLCAEELQVRISSHVAVFTQQSDRCSHVIAETAGYGPCSESIYFCSTATFLRAH